MPQGGRAINKLIGDTIACPVYEAHTRTVSINIYLVCLVYMTHKHSKQRHIFYALVRGLGRDGGIKGGLR